MIVTTTYNLSWAQYEMACRIYETVGASAFTAKIAASILQMDQRKWGSRFFALKNAGAIRIDHKTPRKNAGSAVVWYKFTEPWIRWKDAATAREREEVPGGVAVHVE